jgi:hypothetical protein
MSAGTACGGTRGPVCSYNPRWRALVPRFQKAPARPSQRGPANAARLQPCVEVCRFHGGRGGAPKGKAHAWKHGYYTEAAKAERLLVKLLLKNASSLLKLLSKGET